MSPDGTIAAHFAELTDPRIDRCKRHDLLAIVTIALCGVTCRADSWVEIARLLVRGFSSRPARSATATHTMSTMSDRSRDERVSALRAAIAHTGPMISEAVRIPSTDTTVDQIAADPEQNLPYWAKIWPSGIALAGAIDAPPDHVRGRRVLELGCSVGVTAAVALAAGARLTVTDYAPEALVLAVLTRVRHTGREPDRAETINWRQPAALRTPAHKRQFDIILGADLLHERRDIAPMLAALDVLLAPGGSLWLAEPGCPPATAFPDTPRGGGWHDESARWTGPWADPDDAPCPVPRRRHSPRY